MTLDVDDRATMFEDSGGVLGTSGASSDWGHLEDPTGEIFNAPDLVDDSKIFVTDAAGDLGALAIGATLTVGGTGYTVRAKSRDADGGLVRYLLALNV